jgi:glutathione S-transferase
VIRLIGVPGSHPSLAVELMLRHKGLPYRRFDLANGFHRGILPLLGYRSRTVPVARIDGRRVAGSVGIARALDAVAPQPPLLPADPRARAAVERAETWGDVEVQEDVRAVARWATVHQPESMVTFLDGVRMGVPEGAVRAALPVLRPVISRQLRVKRHTAEACARALPEQLDRVDALLAEGVIGGEQPNAADFQVATCVRLAMCFDQLRERIAARPAGAHALRICPDYPGRFGAVLPEAWIAKM